MAANVKSGAGRIMMLMKGDRQLTKSAKKDKTFTCQPCRKAESSAETKKEK
jgi:hypothetical protein